MSALETPASSPSRRRRGWWIAGVSLLVVAAVGTTVFVTTSSAAPMEQRAASDVETVPVTSGDTVSVSNVTGVLQFSDSQSVGAGVAGVVTELPAAGATVVAGDVLYRVNELPATLMTGSLPAWRDFAKGMDKGEDVVQLQQNLIAFGKLSGEADGEFGYRTERALESWQKDAGLEVTGKLIRGSILFAAHPLRVDMLQVRVGAEVAAGTALYDATSAEQVVALEIESANREIAVADAAVNVVLADGTETPGVVQSVGAAVTKPATDTAPEKVVVPVRIWIADQDALAAFVRSRVTVNFSSTLNEDVLTVPVEALVPIDDTTFGVELPPAKGESRTSRVEVTVGSYGSGRVEISGDGIAEGVEVVVPKR